MNTTHIQTLRIGKDEYNPRKDIMSTFMDAHCCPVTKAASKKFPHAKIETHASYIVVRNNHEERKFKLVPVFNFLKCKETHDRIEHDHRYKLEISLIPA